MAKYSFLCQKHGEHLDVSCHDCRIAFKEMFEHIGKPCPSCESLKAEIKRINDLKKKPFGKIKEEIESLEAENEKLKKDLAVAGDTMLKMTQANYKKAEACERKDLLLKEAVEFLVVANFQSHIDYEEAQKFIEEIKKELSESEGEG